MTDRDYSLANILINKEISDHLKCGICMDVFREPILCDGGHTWCKSCINQTKQKDSCPICCKRFMPAINFPVRDLIGTFLCKCPHYGFSLNTDSGNTSEKLLDSSTSPVARNNKRKITSLLTLPDTSSGVHGVDGGEKCCWTGSYERLQHHLESECPAELRTLCLYATTFSTCECTFKGTKAQLAKHYLACNLAYQLTIGPVSQNLPIRTFVHSAPCLLVLPSGKKCYFKITAAFGLITQHDLHLFVAFSKPEGSGNNNSIPCDITNSILTIKDQHDADKDIKCKFLCNRLVHVSDGSGPPTRRFVDPRPGSKFNKLCFKLTSDISHADFRNYFKSDTLLVIAEIKVTNCQDEN